MNKPLSKLLPFLLAAPIPSDSKLLLTKNYSETIIFENYEFHAQFHEKVVLSWKFGAQNPSKIPKNNSQGIIFVIISCQRVQVVQAGDFRKSFRRGVPEEKVSEGPLRSLTAVPSPAVF